MARSADIVIITALEEERDAVLRKLPTKRRQKPSADDVHVYYTCTLPVKFPNRTSGTYRVVVTSLVRMGPTQAAITTSTVIHKWNPQYILLVGIAGGVAASGVQVGDVLIADQIADYQLQKTTPKRTEVRWSGHQVDARFIAAAQNLKVTTWRKLITVPRPTRGTPVRRIGPIASGPTVIASSQLLAQYQSAWPKLIGVEMEAGGTAAAVQAAAKRLGFFMVRGVSDLADEQKGSIAIEKWRAYACDVAAAYTIALLQHGPIPLTTETKKETKIPVSQTSSQAATGSRRPTTGILANVLFSSPPKAEFKQLDKDKFLANGLAAIRRHFHQSQQKLQKERSEVTAEVVELSPYKFVATLYVNGEAMNRCKVWRGDTSSNSIQYVEGRTIDFDRDNSYQEWLTVTEREGKLRMQIGSGLWGETAFRQGALLTHTEVAQYLWKRFCEPLNRQRR